MIWSIVPVTAHLCNNLPVKKRKDGYIASINVILLLRPFSILSESSSSRGV